MSATVYVESSVISYLASRPSKDLVTAARQAITAEWWEERRSRYEIYISALVEEEISRGDAVAAERRLAYVDGVPGLEVTEQARVLAEALLDQAAVPRGSEEDALHIGIAAASGMDYLLTWNFKHLNNAETKAAIVNVIQAKGLMSPVMCSPEELGA